MLMRGLLLAVPSQTDPRAPALNPRANPKRSIRSTSSPFTSSGNPARQSQPRSWELAPSAGRATRTPELPPEPDIDRFLADPTTSFPRNEKVLGGASEVTDFLRSSREGGRKKGSAGDWSPEDACFRD